MADAARADAEASLPRSLLSTSLAVLLQEFASRSVRVMIEAKMRNSKESEAACTAAMNRAVESLPSCDGASRGLFSAKSPHAFSPLCSYGSLREFREAEERAFAAYDAAAVGPHAARVRESLAALFAAKLATVEAAVRPQVRITMAFKFVGLLFISFFSALAFGVCARTIASAFQVLSWAAAVSCLVASVPAITLLMALTGASAAWPAVDSLATLLTSERAVAAFDVLPGTAIFTIAVAIIGWIAMKAWTVAGSVKSHTALHVVAAAAVADSPRPSSRASREASPHSSSIMQQQQQQHKVSPPPQALQYAEDWSTADPPDQDSQRETS
jgi:hypothetical protein